MRAFVDTNVLAYRLDPDEPGKHRRAIEWLEGEATLVVSSQVLIELHSVLTRRFHQPRSLASEVLERIDYETVPTDRTLVLRAARTASEHQLSIFDALILEAAVSAECTELWSEDLRGGSVLRGVRIVNPFDGVA
ncbi:MAG: PIN domain-containing protein [Nocardioides sp.]|uniref:PIN domain-containing protein n=1 Tax=Nocardioides sp. TaxID=35761 RepID=UPI0039E42A4F